MTKKNPQDQEIIIALKKARSQLDNVIQMVEDNAYCINILQQILSAIGLLKSANNKLLHRHLHSCFALAMRGTNENVKSKMIGEILKITTHINK